MIYTTYIHISKRKGKVENTVMMIGQYQSMQTCLCVDTLHISDV